MTSKENFDNVDTDNITREQFEFLGLVCNNIGTLPEIRFDMMGEFTEKQIFPLLQKHNITWTELGLLGHCLINLAYTKHQERLEKYPTENNKLIKSLIKNFRLKEYDESVNKSRHFLDLSDSVFSKRGEGYDFKIDKYNFISYNLKERFDILKKYDFKCAYCGRSPPDVYLELEHMQPKSKGGLNESNNYCPSCWECNHGKRDIPLEPHQIDLVKKRFFENE